MILRAFVMSCGFLLGAVPAPSSASSRCIDYEDYARWVCGVHLPDQPLSLALEPGWAFVAARDSGLVVIDIGDVTNARIVCCVPTPAAALDVAIAGGLAFVAAGEAGVVVIDVAEPASPRFVTTIATPGPALQIAAAAGHVYVAESRPSIIGPQGVLRVIDVGDPEQPELLGAAAICGVTDLALAGSRAYVVGVGRGIHGAFAGFQAIDVSDPGRPRVVGGVELPNSGWTVTLGTVAVSGSYAYVADGFHGLQVIDVGERAGSHGPRIVGSVETGDRFASVAVSGHALYAATTGGLLVCDVAEAANPRILANVGISSLPSAVAVLPTGNRHEILVCDGQSSYLPAVLMAVDISGLRSAPALGHCDVPNMVHRLAAQGSLVYLANYGAGVKIIDVADPRAPAVCGTVDTPGSAGAVAAVGNVACVADGWPGLQVVDVADPAHPYITGDAGIEAYAIDVAYDGSRAYLAAQWPARLAVVDMENPHHPTLAGSLDIPAGASSVTVAGTVAYVTGEDLTLVDVADPADPHVLGSLAMPFPARGVAVADGRAYVAAAASGLVVVDVSDPEHPLWIGERYTPSLAGVALDGRYLYGADWVAGLVVMDIDDPVDPRIVGNLGLYLESIDLAVVGDLVYVAVANRGLDVMPTQCAASVAREAPARPAAVTADRALPVVTSAPNPCNPRATIDFTMPAPGRASLVVFDARGAVVVRLVDAALAAGDHRAEWTGIDAGGRAVPSGIYFCRLATPWGVRTQKLSVVR